MFYAMGYVKRSTHSCLIDTTWLYVSIWVTLDNYISEFFRVIPFGVWFPPPAQVDASFQPVAPHVLHIITCRQTFMCPDSACSRLHSLPTIWESTQVWTKIIWRVETKSNQTRGMGISISVILEGIQCPYFPENRQITTNLFPSSKLISPIMYPEPVLGTK